MPDPAKPRGKVPEPPSRKPFVVPGIAPWDNHTEQVSNTRKIHDAQPQDGKPTNRSKYENKPMPATPTASPSSSAKPRSHPRVPIQPATPFVKSSRNRQDTQNRAVTEPIMPQPLFATQQKSTPQHAEDSADNKDESIRRQLSSPPSPVVDVASEIQGFHPVTHHGIEPVQNLRSSPPPTTTSEASEFQGFRHPVADNRVRDEVPASAPPTCGTSSAYGSSPGNRSTSSMSTPLPTRRYHQEKSLPTPPVAHESFSSSPQMGRDETQGSNHPEGMIIGDGVLNPTRTGTYARLGEVSFVEQEQRVISQVGQIESIEYPGTGDSRGHPGPTGSQGANFRGPTQYPGTGDSRGHPGPTGLQGTSFRGSTQYAPSTYTGVWENNPHVGHSLPSYGSDVHQFSPNVVHPLVFDRYGRPINRPTSYQSSSNSYAPVSRGNSYASTNAASTARFAHLSPRYVERNAAPAPPRSYPGFQQSGPMSAELTQLEMNLHHHIDNSYDNLARLMIAKLDRLGDHMAMQYDSLEEALGKGLSKTLKNELKGFKKESATRFQENKDAGKEIDIIRKGIDEIGELVKARDLKLEVLKKKIEEGACKCQPQDAETNGSEAARRSPPRRTESADAYLGRGEQHIQPPAGQSSTGGRQASSGGRFSSAGRHQLNDMVLTVPTDANAHRQFFTELGSLAGPPPDLSQHPAYRGVPRESSPTISQDPMAVAAGFMNNEDIAYQVPNFRRDWYKHAFQK